MRSSAERDKLHPFAFTCTHAHCILKLSTTRDVEKLGSWSKPSEFPVDSSLFHVRIFLMSTPFMQVSKGPPIATKSKGLSFFRMSDRMLESRVTEHVELVPMSSNQSGIGLSGKEAMTYPEEHVLAIVVGLDLVRLISKLQ